MIATLEEEISALQEQIAKPETAADYVLLQELCDQCEQKEQQLGETMDRWLMLSEQMA